MTQKTKKINFYKNTEIFKLNNKYKDHIFEIQSKHSKYKTDIEIKNLKDKHDQHIVTIHKNNCLFYFHGFRGTLCPGLFFQDLTKL